MITKENYIELGQVECTECKTALDWNAVDDAIRKYGLIALHRESDGSGYFGYTCPHCIKTNLHKTNKEFLQFLVDGDLNKPIKPPYFQDQTSSHLLAYYSNLKNSPTSLFPRIQICNTQQIGGIASQLNRITFNPCLYPYAYQIHGLLSRFAKFYCSFMPSSLSIGTLLIIQYFVNEAEFKASFHVGPTLEFIESPENPDNVIKTCLKIENKTGTRIFNRYLLIDPIYAQINELHISNENNRKILTQGFKSNRGNYELLGNLDFKNPQYPFDEDNFDTFEIVENDNDSQKQIRKNYNFLNVLCIPYFDVFVGNRQELEFPTRMLFSTDDMKVNFNEIKLIYKDIWNKFHDGNLQKLLIVMADNFLDDYFRLMERIDCSFEKIWNLRQTYLYNIYDSIKSSKIMKQKTQGATNKYIEKFKKLEEPYLELKKIITQSYTMIQIKEKLVTLGEYESLISILLLGETGTGKELFAKALHEINGRPGAFIPINCAAIPDTMFEAEFFGHAKGSFTGATNDKIGLFEQADGGTIFLDEIGELDINFQARLLRVLQEKEITPVGGELKKVDFQLVSATNRNLREMIDAGNFREDLYQRINEYTISIPSLTERKNDIPLLAHQFIKNFDRVIIEDPSLKPLSIEKECLNALENYHWRGNVRELERACKLVMAFRSPEDRSEIDISEFNLKKETEPIKGNKSNKIIKGSAGPGNTKVTDDKVRKALAKHNGNKTKAGEELGVTYATILRRSKNLDI